jgi:hypothetical protein
MIEAVKKYAPEEYARINQLPGVKAKKTIFELEYARLRKEGRMGPVKISAEELAAIRIDAIAIPQIEPVKITPKLVGVALLLAAMKHFTEEREAERLQAEKMENEWRETQEANMPFANTGMHIVTDMNSLYGSAAASSLQIDTKNEDMSALKLLRATKEAKKKLQLKPEAKTSKKAQFNPKSGFKGKRHK